MDRFVGQIARWDRLLRLLSRGVDRECRDGVTGLRGVRERRSSSSENRARPVGPIGGGEIGWTVPLYRGRPAA